MKILLAGDTHGSYGWIKILVRAAVANGCPIICQVGDFGFWEPRGEGRVFLDETSKLLAKNNLELWWIDGNHENHEHLRATYGPSEDNGLWEIREHLLYIPRGHRWEWDGLTFLGLGGAYSVDKHLRTQGVDWWPEETITYAEAEQAIEGGPVDVMVTHDCPVGVDPFGPETAGPKDAFPESYANRKLLTAVCDEVRPSLLLHGHYHHRKSSVMHGADYECRIEGLARDGMWADSYLVFDTGTRSIVPFEKTNRVKPEVTPSELATLRSFFI